MPETAQSDDVAVKLRPGLAHRESQSAQRLQTDSLMRAFTRTRELEFRANCSSGAIVFAIGNLSLLSGLFLSNSGAIAFGVVLLILPTIAYLRLRRTAAAIALQQEAPRSAFEDDTIDVKVVLENASSRTLEHPRFSELFGPDFDAQKNLVFPRRVGPGETVTGSYRGLCSRPRGHYQFGPSVVRLSDSLGWFEVQGRLETNATITIYPRLFDYGLFDSLTGRSMFSAAVSANSQRGESNEFWSVREYRRGDSRRRIHWAGSARRGALVVREYAQPAGGDLAIVLDAHHSFDGAGRKRGALEIALRITASLVARGLASGRRVAVHHQDGRLGPAAGATDAALIDWLEPMVDFSARSEVMLSEHLKVLAPELRSMALVVVMIHHTQFDDPELLTNLLALARGEVRVVAVLFTPADDATAESRRLDFSRKLFARNVETHVVHSKGVTGDELERIA